MRIIIGKVIRSHSTQPQIRKLSTNLKKERLNFFLILRLLFHQKCLNRRCLSFYLSNWCQNARPEDLKNLSMLLVINLVCSINISTVRSQIDLSYCLIKEISINVIAAENSDSYFCEFLNLIYDKNKKLRVISHDLIDHIKNCKLLLSLQT